MKLTNAPIQFAKDSPGQYLLFDGIRTCIGWHEINEMIKLDGQPKYNQSLNHTTFIKMGA